MRTNNLLSSTKRIGIGLSFVIFPIVFVFAFSVHPGLLHPHLLLAPLGFFGGMYIPSLIMPGDATATVMNILANVWLFRLSIMSALTVPIVNIFLVLLLYKLLKPVNKGNFDLGN